MKFDSPSRRSSRQLFAAGALFLAGLTASAIAGSGSVDRLLPPDTLLLFSVDDDEAYTKANESMPFAKIMKEEEVIAFLEKPRGAIKEALSDLNNMLKGQEGFENFDLSFEQLFGGSYGRMFVALTHVGLPSLEAGSPMPDVGLVIGIERREGAPDWQALIKDVIGRVTSKMPPEMAVRFEAVEKDGLRYEELVGGPKERPPVVMGTVGSLQLFSLSPTALAQVMSRAAGSAQSPSLADNAIYQRCVKSVGVDNTGAARFFVNVDAGLRIASAGIKMGMQHAGETDKIPMVDRLIELSGLNALKAIAGASESVDGVAHSRAVTLVEGERKGLLAMMPGRPIDLGHLKLAPKDSTSVMLTQFDLSALYDFAMDAMKEVDEKVHAEVTEQIKGFGQAIGGAEKPLDFRADLLGNIGPEFMMVSPPSNNPMLPAFLMMLEVRNPAVVTDAFTKLIAFASQQSGEAFSVKTSDYKGTTIHQVEMGPGSQIPVAPCFAVKDDFLMFALSTGDLKRQLRSAEKAESDITQNEDFQLFWGKVPQQGVTSLTYTDIKNAVESGYRAVTMALPMLSMAGDIDLPFDMNLLPQQEALTKHLFGSLSYSVDTKDGSVAESYGPFGGEVVGAVLVGAIGLGAVFGLRQEQEMRQAKIEMATPTEPVQDAPDESARRELGNLKAGVTVYKLQHDGALPEQLSDILKPTQDYPKGWIESGELPMDPWGNAYRYQKTDTGFVIWSAGPDGADNAGEGDDIAVRAVRK